MANVAAAMAVMSAILATAAFVMIMIVWSKPEVIAPGSMSSKAESTAETSAAQEPSKEPTQKPGVEPEGNNRYMSGDKDQQRIYVFALVNWRKPYMYIDEHGDMIGSFLEIGRAVCRAAGKECVFPSSGSEPTPCWNSAAMRAIGLEEGWFDGCMGFYKTVERSNVAKFSQPFEGLASGDGFLVKLKNSSKTLADVSSSTVGIAQGYWLSPGCLAINGIDVPKENVRLSPHPHESSVVQMLLDGEVDFAFFGLGLKTDEMETVSQAIQCALQGNGLMVPKASDVLPWFNEGIQMIKDDGTYSKICETSMEKHGEPMLG